MGVTDDIIIQEVAGVQDVHPQFFVTPRQQRWVLATRFLSQIFIPKIFISQIFISKILISKIFISEIFISKICISRILYLGYHIYEIIISSMTKCVCQFVG